MLRVLHSNKFLEYMFHGESTLPATVMLEVAHVDTNSPDMAYQLTNHLDTRWTDNPGVTPIGIKPNCAVRSTSVGDLLVEGTPGNTASKHLIVEVEGFRELTREEICSLIYAIPE
jgi:hypothetical protein